MEFENKLTDRNYLPASIASSNLVFYVVDVDKKDESVDGSSFQITLTELKKILGIDVLLGETFKEGSYLDIPDLLTNQQLQTVGRIQFVQDASLFFPSIPGYGYFEYLGPETGLASNYRRLNAQEISVIESQNVGLYKIGDYMVDRKGGNNTTIKSGNILYGVGSFLATEYIIAIALIDNPTTINHLNIIYQYII